MNRRFLLRELLYGRGLVIIFILCSALSLISIVAVNGLRRDIHESLASDARNLSGGDIIIHSHYQFTRPLLTEVDRLADMGQVQVARSREFMSMARDSGGRMTVLAQVKAVEPGYPPYGEVRVASGRPLGDVLAAGKVVVAPAVLAKLQLRTGDALVLGARAFVIADTVVQESQRPVEFLSFGPRIFMTAADLDSLGLVGQGSRAHYELLLRVMAPDEIDLLAGKLSQVALQGQERVRTYASAGSRVTRFFDNLLFFLSLTSVFTMLLAGIGMQSSLTAILRRRQDSLAVMRSLGATSRFIYTHYLLFVVILCLLGSLLGIGGGLLLEKTFPYIFQGILPSGLELGGAPVDVVEGLIIGLTAALFFTLIPLLQIKDVKPVHIFRKESGTSSRNRKHYLLVLVGILLFGLLVVHQLDDVKLGLYFLGGTLVLIGAVALLATVFLKIFARSRVRNLVLRQAVRSLLRPGNNTRAVIVTLGAAMALLLSLYLIERNLDAGYIASYPEGAPNLFSLDIQKDQRAAFLALTGGQTELFPVIRARLMSIDGRKVKRDTAQNPRGDNLVREFNLTYRDHLLGDEKLLEGRELFGMGVAPGMLPVSILDTVADMGDMKMGDILEFNIQGVPLKAQVTSVRKRTRSMLYPFFYFVFPEKSLENAPQTFFAALKVKPENAGRLELDIVKNFPNVSTIDVGETAAELGRIMRKLSLLITFFASFSIFAGVLLLISSILATRLERSRESVYYKVLGAGSKFVRKVFFLENLLLALVSGVCALLLAQAISWGVCVFFLDTGYDPNMTGCIGMIALGMLLIALLGVLSSLPIVRRRPARFLREDV